MCVSAQRYHPYLPPRTHRYTCMCATSPRPLCYTIVNTITLLLHTVAFVTMRSLISIINPTEVEELYSGPTQDLLWSPKINYSSRYLQSEPNCNPITSSCLIGYILCTDPDKGSAQCEAETPISPDQAERETGLSCFRHAENLKMFLRARDPSRVRQNAPFRDLCKSPTFPAQAQSCLRSVHCE